MRTELENVGNETLMQGVCVCVCVCDICMCDVCVFVCVLSVCVGERERDICVCVASLCMRAPYRSRLWDQSATTVFGLSFALRPFQISLSLSLPLPLSLSPSRSLSPSLRVFNGLCSYGKTYKC